MKTQIYDSAEPGPPRGWLDLGTPLSEVELRLWVNIVLIIMQDILGDGPGKISPASKPVSFPQYWGALYCDGLFWIYRLLPAGKDRFQRAGRTLTALFCASTPDEFNWKILAEAASELENAALSPTHRSKVIDILGSSQQTLIDGITNSEVTSLESVLEGELGTKLKKLETGAHYSVAIDQDGCVTVRPLVHHRVVKNVLGPAQPPAGLRKSPSQHTKNLRMKTHVLTIIIFVWLASLALSFLVGYSVSPSPEHRPSINDDKELLRSLRSATDYLERKVNKDQFSSSPDESEAHSQRPTPGNPRSN